MTFDRFIISDMFSWFSFLLLPLSFSLCFLSSINISFTIIIYLLSLMTTEHSVRSVTFVSVFFFFYCFNSEMPSEGGSICFDFEIYIYFLFYLIWGWIWLHVFVKTTFNMSCEQFYFFNLK